MHPNEPKDRGGEATNAPESHKRDSINEADTGHAVIREEELPGTVESRAPGTGASVPPTDYTALIEEPTANGWTG